MSQRLLSKKTRAAELTVIAPRTSPFPRNSIFKKDIVMPQHSFGIGDDFKVKITKSDGLFPDVKTSINPLQMYKDKGRGSGHNTMRESPVNPIWVRSEMLPIVEDEVGDILSNESLNKETREAFLYLPGIIRNLKRFRDEAQADPNLTKTAQDYLTSDEYYYFLALRQDPPRLQRLLQEVISKNVISATDLQALTQSITALQQPAVAPVTPAVVTPPQLPQTPPPLPIQPPPIVPVPPAAVPVPTPPVPAPKLPKYKLPPKLPWRIVRDAQLTAGAAVLPVSFTQSEIRAGTPTPRNFTLTTEQEIIDEGIDEAKLYIPLLFTNDKTLTLKDIGKELYWDELKDILGHRHQINTAFWRYIFGEIDYITSTVYNTLTKKLKFNLADSLKDHLSAISGVAKSAKAGIATSGNKTATINHIVNSFGTETNKKKALKAQYIKLRAPVGRFDGNP